MCWGRAAPFQVDGKPFVTEKTKNELFCTPKNTSNSDTLRYGATRLQYDLRQCLFSQKNVLKINTAEKLTLHTKNRIVNLVACYMGHTKQI